jgi:hypothetical protein
MNNYLERQFWQLRELQRALDQLQPQMRALDSIPRAVREQLQSLNSIRDRFSLPTDYLIEFGRIRKAVEASGQLYQLKMFARSDSSVIQEVIESQKELEFLSIRIAGCSDLSSPSIRVLETLSSVEALFETGRLRQEVIAAAIQPQLAYQKFAREQLELAAHASGVAQVERLMIVDAAADLLEEMSKGFELAALMCPADLDVKGAPGRVVNVFTELTQELGTVNLEGEGRGHEHFVSSSKSARVTDRGGGIIRLVYNLNVEAEREGKPPIFKPTSKTLYGCSVIPTYIATDELAFAQIVDHLYFLLYEGSGDATRLTERRSANQFEALWSLKHLRLGFRHDVDHGSHKETEKKNRQVGEVYNSLIGKVAPRSRDDWIQAQIALYDNLTEMLELIWFDDK